MYDGYAEGDEDPYDVEEPEYDGEDEEGWEDDGDQGDFVMDADYLPGGDKYEGPTAGGSDHAGKVKLPAAAKLEGKDAHIDKLLEEYYQLNFEGFAGGMPTRFKYRKVEPTNFGLTPVEILLADEQDLNAFVSLKKLAPYVFFLFF
jgi:protein KRI1